MASWDLWIRRFFAILAKFSNDGWLEEAYEPAIIILRRRTLSLSIKSLRLAT